MTTSSYLTLVNNSASDFRENFSIIRPKSLILAGKKTVNIENVLQNDQNFGPIQASCTQLLLNQLKEDTAIGCSMYPTLDNTPQPQIFKTKPSLTIHLQIISHHQHPFRIYEDEAVAQAVSEVVKIE